MRDLGSRVEQALAAYKDIPPTPENAEYMGRKIAGVVPSIATEILKEQGCPEALIPGILDGFRFVTALVSNEECDCPNCQRLKEREAVVDNLENLFKL